MAAIVFCAGLILVYYGSCAFAVFCGGSGEIKKGYTQISFWYKILILITIFATMMITVYWMKQNHFVYYWDYSLYWGSSIERMQYIFANTPSDVLRSLIHSINYDDYNNFLPTIIALPMKYFGCSFPRYVFINHIMFLLPAVFVQALSSMKLVGHRNIGEGTTFIIALVLASFFPANYYAMYRGYIDVAILLPISIVIYLFIDYDFSQGSVMRDISIAFMLVLAWLSRRYVIYFIIGYVAALGIKAFLAVYKKRTVNVMKMVILHFMVIGGISLGIFAIFFRQFLVRALFTDYKSMFSAYDASYSAKMGEFISSFGYVTIVVLGLIGILCFVFRKNRINYISLLAIIVIETLLFWNVQVMGSHHRLIVNVPMVMIFVLGWDLFEMKGLENERCKSIFLKLAIGGSFFVLILNFVFAYAPVPLIKNENLIFADKYLPMQRKDIDELEKIVKYLNDNTRETGEKIYVAASGGTLNSDILKKFYMPYSSNAVPNMYTTYDVDLRDGFPTEFLSADYVVATEPVELHLMTGQEVVGYLAKGIQDEMSFIGRHFQEVNRFELDNVVIVKIYHKSSDWVESDLEQLREYYNSIYPEYKELFEDRIYYEPGKE